MAFTTSPTSAPNTDVKESKRSAKLEEIRNYHKDLIADLGIPRTDFNIKRGFYDQNGKFVVGIYSSEFLKEKGFYFEVIDREYEPVDTQNRTVYRIPYNPHYAEEYDMNGLGSYLVPIEELRKVNPVSVAISGPTAVVGNQSKQPAVKPATFATATSSDDEPYSEMTIRDYYAIQSGKPVSNKTWLNDLIKKNS